MENNITNKPLNLLEEIHGDTCRLGFFKLISCIGNDFQPFSLNYFVAQFYDLIKKYQNQWNFPSYSSKTGLLSIKESEGKHTAKNYILLSYNFKILNKKHQTLDNFGRIYNKTDSAKEIFQYIKNTHERTRNILLLNDVEKVMFLNQLITIDNLIIVPLIKWLSKKNEVQRGEAINFIMENIYKSALEKMYQETKDYNKKLQLDNEIKNVSKYPEIRERKQKTGEWTTSKEYYKYRHTAPPRLEWLVDVGLLMKKERGKFISSPIIKKLNDENFLDNILYDEMIYKISKIFLPKVEKIDSEGIKHFLIECYDSFSKAGYLSVDTELLKQLIVFRLLESNKITEFYEIDRVLKILEEMDSKSIKHHVDLYGKPRFVKIDIEIVNKLQL